MYLIANRIFRKMITSQKGIKRDNIFLNSLIHFTEKKKLLIAKLIGTNLHQTSTLSLHLGMNNINMAPTLGVVSHLVYTVI